MAEILALRAIDPSEVPSTTDLVFRELYERVIQLALPPGAKVSEAEVAAQMDVSRQPVRDAFYRLQRLDLIRIRPQRATRISPISIAKVEEARFIRTAIELETIRLAIERMDAAGLAALDDLIAHQTAAVEKGEKQVFHLLDDEFHKTICAIAGHEPAWTLIKDNKAHMDRVRYISLSFGAQSALDDHLVIMENVRSGDVAGAQARLRKHLGHIHDIIAQVRGSHSDYFDG